MRHCFAEEMKTFLVPDPATYTRRKRLLMEFLGRVSCAFRFGRKTNLVGQSHGGSRHCTDKEEEQINQTCIIFLLKAAS